MKWNWAHKTKFRIHNSDIQRKCIKLCKENILKIQIIYKNNGKNTGRNSIYSYFRWKNFRKEISIGKTKKVQKNMRIWKINPKLMCRKHLLGEHVESHMFVGSINKRRSIQGHIEKGQVEIHNLKSRHKELANEMKRRGYNHKSPLPKFKVKIKKMGEINIKQNLKELSRRCKECRKLINLKNNKKYKIK